MVWYTEAWLEEGRRRCIASLLGSYETPANAINPTELTVQIFLPVAYD